MKKDFQRWHKKKEEVNDLSKSPFFHEREIWFFYLGANVGFEQDGRGDDFLRPVVVVRKFNNEIFWAIPLTKAGKKIKQKAEKYYLPFIFIKGIKSVAILSQIRLIDARRLARHIGIMGDSDFQKLTKRLKEIFP